MRLKGWAVPGLGRNACLGCLVPGFALQHLAGGQYLSSEEDRTFAARKPREDTCRAGVS
jgi:hypothetical protein